MKFTKEEISLCKQVREKDLLLKPVKEGDWVRNEYGKESTDLVTPEYIQNVLRFIDIKHWFPLWTISDCLEFFFQRGWQLEEFFKNGAGTFSFHTCKGEEDYHFELGKTPLEALLKAVLAVLEENR